MSLRESYIANWRNLPKEAIKIRVARPSVLAPSKELLRDWKEGRITWGEYEERYRQEILSNPKAVRKLLEIKALAEEKEVYLLCYEREPPCHRFILIELIEGLGVDVFAYEKEANKLIDNAFVRSPEIKAENLGMLKDALKEIEELLDHLYDLYKASERFCNRECEFDECIAEQCAIEKIMRFIDEHLPKLVQY